MTQHWEDDHGVERCPHCNNLTYSEDGTCSACGEEMYPEESLYEIVRFGFKGENKVIKTSVTLEEAQEHCQREDTRGEGWFDGYRRI